MGSGSAISVETGSADGAAPRTVLVLGGGGMKGMAHIGAWKALEEAGIEPDAIIGTSIGALVGACLAGGLGWRDLAEIARGLQKSDIVEINRRAVWLGGVREPSVFMGDRFREYIEKTLPVSTFAEMKMPLNINATSLVTGEEVWYGTNVNSDAPLAEAVYSSCALPIYFPPGRIDDDVLVDGGILDVLPIRRAREWGATRIIAVDVGSDLMPPDEGHFDRGMIAVHDRVLSIHLERQRERCITEGEGPGLVYIHPQIGHLHGFDFDRTSFFLEEGYHAARKALRAEEAA